MLYFCIDLDCARPEVLEYSGDALKEDLEFFKVSDPMELQTFDRRVFKSESDAEKYLHDYFSILNQLSLCTYNHRNRPKLPCMLLKTRYIILTMRKEKTFTVRNYKKDWKPGQHFLFHDQKHFLEVELVKIEKDEDGDFVYDFRLAN